jgi:hypothetical protein
MPFASSLPYRPKIEKRLRFTLLPATEFEASTLDRAGDSERAADGDAEASEDVMN